MFFKKERKENSVVFVKDNTLGDTYLYLRTGDFDGGPRVHYLYSLVERKIKAIPDDLYRLTYTPTNDLVFADFAEPIEKGYYLDEREGRVFMIFQRVSVSSTLSKFAVVGSFIDVALKQESFDEGYFKKNFKEIRVGIHAG